MGGVHIPRFLKRGISCRAGGSMKKILIFAFIIATATGCSTVKKEFSVIVEPADAEIRVLPGEGQAVQTYKSPATITVYVPKNPAEAAKSRMEIKRDTYKTKIIGLDMIAEKTLKIKLDKVVLYRLKYRMIRPVLSEDLGYRDKIVSIRIVPGERQFELKMENLTQKPLKILWDRAEYIDLMNRQHPLMHSGIKPENRNDIVQPQIIPAGGSVQESVFPKSSVAYLQGMKEYTTKLLFPVDSDTARSLTGRLFSVFLPVELDRAIIPDYNFKFEIVDVIKE